MHDLLILIFSKDRPLQLDGTLRSFSRHCRGADGVPVRVLYTASTSRNRSLYRQVMREHPEIHFVEEFDFRRDTMFLLGLHEFVLFVVDDCLFVSDISLADCTAALLSHPDAIGVSLRLGRNTTHCYTVNKPQRLPNLQPASESLLAFNWPGMDCDFGYPLDVSSSLYRAADLLKVLADVPFGNPNTLEAELANRAGRFRESHPVLLCPGQSLAFCAPVNIVQQVCANRAGTQPSLSAAALAEKFADGWRIDVSLFDGFVPTGCHQEVELPLAKVAEPVPVVSVIVPCYKQAQFLREAVESVVAQTFTDWELIIVDDGSPDDTAATAQAIIAEYPGRSIRLLRKRNGGVSEARNVGIRMACGAYILPLDADDIIRPTMLEKTVQVLESNPDIAIAYTDITHFGAVDRTIQAAEFDAAKIPLNNQLNCCSLYRREAWELSGGYRSLYWGYEDWDFWVGCAAVGLQAARVPESLLLYRVKDASRDTVAVTRDGELRARIVLNHPELYSPARVAEARSLLTARPEPMSPGAPLVSVIVPTHNRPELLCAALRSILAQTMQDFEIIVVNDAGLDISPWVRSLEEPERIRVLRHPRNRGIAGARNTGLRAARGKYIAYLDDDDLFYPNHLAVLVEAAEGSGKAIVYSNGYQASYSMCEGQTVVEHRLVYSGNFQFRDLLVLNQLPVLCVLQRRSCIDKVGGFEETFGTHEDWDMWIRLFHQFDYKHIAQITCEYRVERNRNSLTNTKRPDFYRTMKIIYQQYRHLASAYKGTTKAQRKMLSALARELRQSGKPVDPLGKIHKRIINYKTKYICKIKNIFGTIASIKKQVDDIGHRAKQKVLATESSTNRVIISPLLLVNETLTNILSKIKKREWFKKEKKNEYHEWIHKYDTLDSKKRSEIIYTVEHLSCKPAISVIMPCYNSNLKFLKKAIESVINQLYPYWELCIADDASTDPRIRKLLEKYMSKDSRIKVAFRDKNGHISEASNTALSMANGEWFAFMDHDDLLAENALYEVACAINENPEVLLVYSDEDKIDKSGRRFDPHFKSDWNPDLLLSQNYISHLTAIKSEIVKKVKGFRKGFEGSQDYDLILRAIRKIDGGKIHHIAKILYHWRAIPGSVALEANQKDYTTQAGIKAIKDYFIEKNVNAEVGMGHYPNTYNVTYRIPKPEPLVSIIIPTRDQIELTQKCLNSIFSKTNYKNFEIIIIDNESEDIKTLEYFAEIQREKANVRVIKYIGEFNYSAINNYAVNFSCGKFIGLLNNDIEVISPNWLSVMVSHAIRPEIGCVGAKLYYSDNRIQHAGVILGIGGVAGHSHKKYKRDHPGYFSRLHLTQNLSAVTAACLMIRRDVFDLVGGFDEDNLKIAFNDIDLCLKVKEAGYRNIWTPYAELYHHESASRGYEDTPEKQRRFEKEVDYMKLKWGKVLSKDPYYNPNLTLEKENFSIKNN